MSTSKEMRDAASFMRDLEHRCSEEIFQIAQRLAHGFRDKFDFSEPGKHYAAMAEMSWLAAEALLERKQQALNKANKQYEKDIEKADMQAQRELREVKP